MNKYREIIREYNEYYPQGISAAKLAASILDANDFDITHDKLRQYVIRYRQEIRDTITPENVKVEQSETLDQSIKKILSSKNSSFTIEEISDKFDVSPKKVRDAIESLKSSGTNVTSNSGQVYISSIVPKKDDTVMSVSKNTKGLYRFGAVGDNHLGSKYERLDVLNSLYELFREEGISTVYNTGNWIDGEARFNKHDIHVHGMDNQINYMIKKYPQVEGIKTYYIGGDDHEGWYTQREGVDIGKYLEYKAQAAGRNDLVYLGHMEHDVVIPAEKGETKIRVLHPGGGSSYAISYTSQKIVESLSGNEKPHIILGGHYHKAEYTYARGVHFIQTGCTQDQTPFMRKKKLAAHLGGWIVEFGVDETGAITRFKQEFIPFYDKAYYKNQWSYKF